MATSRLLLAPDSTTAADAPPPKTGYDDAFAGIDAIEGDGLKAGPAEAPETPAAPAPAPAVTAPETPAPAAAAPAPAAPAPASKPDKFGLDKLTGLPESTAKPATAAKVEASPATPTSLKQFREQYELTKRERDDLAGKVKELEQAKADGTRKDVEIATTALKAEMDGIRKRADELDSEVRYLDYTRSDDYKAKFETPLRDAWKAALDDIDGMVITEPDGTERAASHADISALLTLPTAKAAVLAQEKFGAAAMEIMTHRRRLLELQSGRQNAIKDWKTKGAERHQTQQQIQKERISSVQATVRNAITKVETDYPTLFGQEEGDTEGNQLLADGDRLAALALRGEGVDESIPDDERLELIGTAQAQLAVRAKAFGRERLRTLRLQQKVKELEAKLAGFNGSEPGHAQATEKASKIQRAPEDDLDDLPGQ